MRLAAEKRKAEAEKEEKKKRKEELKSEIVRLNWVKKVLIFINFSGQTRQGAMRSGMPIQLRSRQLGISYY